MAQGLAVTAAGQVAGLAVAALLARLTGTLLYAVSPGDPWTYAGVAILVLLVAMLACFFRRFGPRGSIRSARCARGGDSA